MITIGEVLQRVQSEYSKGVESNDTRLTDRHIYDVIKGVRSTLIRQQANKKQVISNWMYQLLPCVELISAPLHECVGVPTGQTLLRTKYKLPSLITGLDCMLVKPIMDLDGMEVFDETTFADNRYSKGNKYTSNKRLFYPKNGYFYFTQVKLLRTVPIEGLFDDPVEAWRFPSLCDDDCNCDSNLELPFPIDGNLLDTMIDMAVPKAIAVFKQMSEDTKNNSADDSATVEMLHQPRQ